MKNQNHAILLDNLTLSVMCLRPTKVCALQNVFKDVNNVSTYVMTTPSKAQVLEFKIEGKDDAEMGLLGVVHEMARQMCAMCQSGVCQKCK